MKGVLKKINIILLFFFCINMDVISKEKLTIRLENVKVSTGKIYVAVFKTKRGFETEKIYKRYVLSHKVRTLIITLNEGVYSIKLFQDINNDKTLNYIFGIPREPYGLSNNPQGFPTWENTSFKLLNNKEIKIRMSF